MKLFTARTLLIAAVVSLLVCVPFLPSVKENPDVFVVQVEMAAATGGHAQLFYDRGGGFDEAQSSSAALRGNSQPAIYAFALPVGTFDALRFDPTDRDGHVSIRSVKIVTRRGTLVREIPLSELKPHHQIATAKIAAAALEIEPEHGAVDAQLLIVFTPRLTLALPWSVRLSTWWQPTLIWALLAALLLAFDRQEAWRKRAAAFARSLTLRPGRAVALGAVIAVLASSYPVVFLGKSFVSPNLGTVLLYENLPTLPGYTDESSTDVMGSDIGAIMWQHVPLSMVQARALRHGELPLWNRYNSSGTPLLGQGQSMFGDPVHFLVIAANGAAWAWDAKYLFAKWLFAFGLGLLVLEVGRRPISLSGDNRRPGGEVNALPFDLLPAIIVAMAAPFIGFFLYRVNHPAYFSLCYAPWPLYGWIRLTRAVTRRTLTAWCGGLMLANLALMNSGTAKEAYMLLLTMNATGAVVLLSAARSWRERATKLAAAAWAGVLFLLLTAPIWATFLHELKIAYTSYNSVSAFQIQPSVLLGFFDEIFYRPLMPANQTFNPSLNFLLLAGVLYFAATLRHQFANRTVTAIAAVSLVPLALAFGLVPPSWIVRVPFLGNIAHIDNTFSCALIILWSILAGAGFALAARRLGTSDGRGDLAIAGLLLFALVSAWIAFGQAAHRPIFGSAVGVNTGGHELAVTAFIWWYLLALLLALLLLALVCRGSLARGQFSAAAALVLVGCAFVLCWRHGQLPAAAGFESFVNRPTTRVAFHARSQAVSLVQATQSREPSRAYGIRGNFFPGWTAAYGLETIHGPDALMNGWYRELVGAMSGVNRIWDWRLYLEPTNVAIARPYFDALNVRYYLDLHSDQGLMGRSLKLVQAADLDVYESPTVWPRAFFTDRVFAYERVEELTQRIRDSDGRPFAAAWRGDLATDPSLGKLLRPAGERTVLPATRYRLSENNTEFDVHASGPGVVVLSETLWPGDFRAFVNGTKSRVIRLNHAFKGVVLDRAGDFHVAFRYVPKGWYVSLGLSAIGTLLLLASAWLGLRQGNPGPE